MAIAPTGTPHSQRYGRVLKCVVDGVDVKRTFGTAALGLGLLAVTAAAQDMMRDVDLGQNDPRWPRYDGVGEKRWRNGSARSCALRGGIHGVERLARGHEQAVALGAAEADVAAHLGQADPTDELAVRRPYRHTAIADVAAGIA